MGNIWTKPYQRFKGEVKEANGLPYTFIMVERRCAIQFDSNDCHLSRSTVFFLLIIPRNFGPLPFNTLNVAVVEQSRTLHNSFATF